jgi:O-antigen/teichoic acid export membrane protein
MRARAVTLYPSFSRFSYDATTTRTRQAYAIAVRYSALVVMPLTLLLIAVAQPMITTLYGTRYPLAANFFVGLMLPMLFIGLGFVVGSAFLSSQGDTRGASVHALLQAITSVILAPIGLHVMGVDGFILTQVIGVAISCLYLLQRLNQRFHITPDYRYLGKLLTSTLGATLLALTTSVLSTYVPAYLMLLIRTLVFGVTLLILLPLTRTLTRTDLTQLQHVADTVAIIRPLIHALIHVEEWLMTHTHAPPTNPA